MITKKEWEDHIKNENEKWQAVLKALDASLKLQDSIIKMLDDRK